MFDEESEMLYYAYIEWVVDNHLGDCPYILREGADDGSLEAYENQWMWEEFLDYLGAK